MILEIAFVASDGSGPRRFAEAPGVGKWAEREGEVEGGGQRVLAGIFGGESGQGEFGFSVVFEVGSVPKRENGGIADEFAEYTQEV
jgi:hypothetical protein